MNCVNCLFVLQCDSSYIITFYSAFFVENRISICTEYMDGGSLDVYRRIPEHVLGRISVAVVKGLTYLWSLKILHRDVKPSNMLVNTRGQVKLCDFGVSTQLVNSIAKTYVGTNAYMAPERISGEQYGIHSDVWSVGISFMEVIAECRCLCIQKNQGSLMPLQLLQCIVDESFLMVWKAYILFPNEAQCSDVVLLKGYYSFVFLFLFVL
uniref:mitogen-activated protein kinase kinase n=1 Tax=Salmo trutta TaxID=8032 RepID=A0A674BC89_SALTR